MSVDPTESSLICRNCGWSVERFYCPNCGQHIGNHNSRVWPLVQESLEEFVRLDSKLIRTLGPLITRPGFLTREWTAGKRVSYISPLKLYITISALCFLALSTVSGSLFSIQPHLHVAGLNDEALHDQLMGLGTVDPKSLRDHFFMHLPTASLLVIPLTALIFSGLYFRRRRFYVEHLVFTLHYNSFCYLTFGLAALTRWDGALYLAFLWSVAYLAFAIKENYDQGWLKTFVKFSIFSVLYSVLIAITVLGTAVFAASMASMRMDHHDPLIPSHTHDIRH